MAWLRRLVRAGSFTKKGAIIPDDTVAGSSSVTPILSFTVIKEEDEEEETLTDNEEASSEDTTGSQSPPPTPKLSDAGFSSEEEDEDEDEDECEEYVDDDDVWRVKVVKNQEEDSLLESIRKDALGRSSSHSSSTSTPVLPSLALSSLVLPEKVEEKRATTVMMLDDNSAAAQPRSTAINNEQTELNIDQGGELGDHDIERNEWQRRGMEMKGKKKDDDQQTTTPPPPVDQEAAADDEQKAETEIEEFLKDEQLDDGSCDAPLYEYTAGGIIRPVCEAH